MKLDIRTMYFVIAIVSVTNALAMLIGWRTYVRRSEMTWWLLSAVTLMLGIILLSLRGLVPAVIPVIGGNVSVMLSMAALYVGCRLAVDLKPEARQTAMAVASLAALQLLFYFGVELYRARTFVMSLATIGFPLASALVLWRSARKRTSRAIQLASVLLTMITLVQLIRFALAMRTVGQTNALGTDVGPTISFTIALMLWLLLSFVLLIITGDRLQEEAIAAKQQLDRATQAGLEALRESEDRFTLAVEGSSTGIWDWNIRSNSFFISAVGRRLLGYAEDEGEASYDDWIARVHPDDLPNALLTVREYLRGGDDNFVLEHRLRHKAGSFRWVLSRGASRRDADGKVYRIAGSTEDVTERRHAEEAQAFFARHAHNASDQEFFVGLARFLADTVQADAVFIDRLSSDGLTAYGEAACVDGRAVSCQVVGVQESALGAYHDDGVRTLVAGAWERFPQDERLQQLRAESYVGITLTNAKGQPIGVISVIGRSALRVPKVTESLLTVCALPAAGELLRKQSDQALRAREEYSRTLLESLPAGVVVHAPDTSILDSNAMASAILGLSSDQLRGKAAIDPLWAFLNEDRTPMRLEEFPVNRVGMTGKPLNGLVVGMQVPGRAALTWAVCNAYPVLNSDGQIQQVVVTFVDVTERIRSEEARDRLESQLRQSQKMEAVGQLAGGIAHDFNNLLTVITGIADVAARNVSPDDPLRRDLSDIQRAGQRAAVLTRQLLAFGRKQTIAPEVLNMRALLDGMQPLLARVIREDIRLVMSPGNSDASVLADPGQIEQILLNLTLNARDAMPNGGMLSFELATVNVNAVFAHTHPGMRPGPHLRVNVRDTGTGMDEATRARVFEPFYTTKAPGQGTGLGLATVYGIVTQSHGAIEVSTMLGAGSTFSVYLPLVGQHSADELATTHATTPLHVAAHHASESVAARNEAHGSILVVEDEVAIRRLAQRILEHEGYAVLTACDGVDALRVLAEHGAGVDLLLTDVIMPNMGGPELAARIAELYPATKVLYASGYAGDADLRLHAIGASSNFLGKPYQVVELTQKVREIMSRSRT